MSFYMMRIFSGKHYVDIYIYIVPVPYMAILRGISNISVQTPRDKTGMTPTSLDTILNDADDNNNI